MSDDLEKDPAASTGERVAEASDRQLEERGDPSPSGALRSGADPQHLLTAGSAEDGGAGTREADPRTRAAEEPDNRYEP